MIEIKQLFDKEKSEALLFAKELIWKAKMKVIRKWVWKLFVVLLTINK